MAEDEVRNNDEPKRPAMPNRGKRREPPVIDGTASDITPDADDKDAASEAGTAHIGAAASPAGEGIYGTPEPDKEAVAPGSLNDASVHTPDMAEAAAQAASGPAVPPSFSDPGLKMPDPRRPSRFPALLSLIGVVLAVLLGAILYTLYNPPPDLPSRGNQAGLADLSKRVAALESRPSIEPTNIGPVEDRLAKLEAGIGQVQAGVADANAKAQQDAAAQQPPVDLSPLENRVSELEKGLANLQAGLNAIPKLDPAALNAQLADQGAKLADLSRGLVTVQTAISAIPKINLEPIETRLADLDKRIGHSKAAPIAVTAQTALRLLDQGKPLAREVTALQALGVEPGKLAPLQAVADKGATSREDLIRAFEDRQDTILKVTTPQPTGSTLDRLMANARSIVKVRPAGSLPGNDADAVVSRINADLNAGNFNDAYTEWQKLPEDGRAASQSWADKLNSRVAAENAAQGILSDAIQSMGDVR